MTRSSPSPFWIRILFLAGLLWTTSSLPFKPAFFSPLLARLPAMHASRKPIRYIAQSGDSLTVVALRFGIQADEIVSPRPLPKTGFLIPGQLLLIPPLSVEFPPALRWLPDSEIVYGPSALSFIPRDYLQQTNGFLKTHRQYLHSTGWTGSGDIIQRVAIEYSINPRLLLALLEWECRCVLGQPDPDLSTGTLLGIGDFRRNGLYGQLSWAASTLSTGYYGWRTGLLREVTLPDGIITRLAPDSNAGSVALLVYFSQQAFQSRTEGDFQSFAQGFPALYRRMFGDPWERARQVEPIFPAGVSQLEMTLPFMPGDIWSYSSGPHPVWDTAGAQAALDFAPKTEVTGCFPSEAWVVAVADGPVVRSGFGSVVQDLDGETPSDLAEQTGWAVLYHHIESLDRVPEGVYLHAGDRIGRPSCEGGPTTGTHLHLARKYNGEWISAGGPLPFTMDGWITHAGQVPYQGTLVKDGQIVIAHPYGSADTLIYRPVGESLSVRTMRIIHRPEDDDR